jgi:hypothetical protein
MHHILEAAGVHIPVITLYHPLSYDKKEREDLAAGNFTSFTRRVETIIKDAKEKMHGSASTHNFSQVALAGMSLGCMEVVGAAVGLMKRERTLQVSSLILQEMLIGQHNLPSLMAYTQTIGHTSEHSMEGYVAVGESAARMALDAHGNEPDMLWRMVGAVGYNWKPLQGMVHPETTREVLEGLVEKDVPLTVALAENSRASRDTAQYLPDDPLVQKIVLAAPQGEKLGHIVDEHHNAVAQVVYQGLQYRDKIHANTNR